MLSDLNVIDHVIEVKNTHKVIERMEDYHVYMWHDTFVTLRGHAHCASIFYIHSLLFDVTTTPRGIECTNPRLFY